MYFDTLGLECCRSCQVAVSKFRSDLTVLVGENNGGKSNVTDGRG